MPTPLFRPEDVPAPAWFGRYNFQREEDVARLTTALGATDGPSIVLLSGEPGIGRRYILQAAVHRLHEAGAAPEEILEIDLEGYDEEVDLAKYLELQLEKRRTEQGEHQKERRDALVSAMSLGLKGTGLATLLSAALSLKEPAAALKKLFGDAGKGHSGELFSAREVFAAFVSSLSGKVILHVVDPSLFHAVPSPENPRRWLPEVAERFPHVVLVVSCGPEDQVVDLVPGARHEVERIELRRLEQQDLRALLDQRFAPNAFPPDLAETLLRYGKGHSGLLGRTLWRLENEEALAEDEHWIWGVDDAKVAKLLSEELLDPLSQAFHERPGLTQALWKFLLDAALCGDLVPANILVNLQGLAEEVEEQLIDQIDEELVERLVVFEDLEYTHPGFPASVSIYRFREPLVRLAVLEHFSLRERRKRAAEIAPALRHGLPVRTRDAARLFVTLAEHLGEADRDEYLRDLAWWVGSTEAEELRGQLAAEIAEGRLEPETLWGALEGSEDRWPAYRRLALLDAYGIGPRDEEGNPLGVPWERLGAFHMLRASLLFDLGQYHEAMGHAEHAVRICKAQSGKHSLPYLYAAGLVGLLMKALGDFAGAKKTLGQVLALEEKLIGPEHPGTLTTKHTLAWVLKDLGEPGRARELVEEVLEARERLLGTEHPDTLTAKHNLASVLEDLDEPDRARELVEEVLEARARLLGREHPRTLATKHSLASVLKDLGEPDRARELFREVLEARARLLGTEHPDTLTAKHNLAGVLDDLGDLARARELFEEVLEARARLLGEEHPRTLATKHNLAGVLDDLGDLVRARGLFEEVLEAQARLLGTKHPRTLTTKHSLAGVLKDLGEPGRARELYEEVLEAEARLLGTEHPRTLTTKHNLACALNDIGEPGRARELFDEVLEARARLLGTEHPRTLATKHSLAWALRAGGDLVGARDVFGQVLEARSRVLGPEHPKTKETWKELLKLG